MKLANLQQHQEPYEAKNNHKHKPDCGLLPQSPGCTVPGRSNRHASLCVPFHAWGLGRTSSRDMPEDGLSARLLFRTCACALWRSASARCVPSSYSCMPQTDNPYKVVCSRRSFRRAQRGSGSRIADLCTDLAPRFTPAAACEVRGDVGSRMCVFTRPRGIDSKASRPFMHSLFVTTFHAPSHANAVVP